MSRVPSGDPAWSLGDRCWSTDPRGGRAPYQDRAALTALVQLSETGHLLLQSLGQCVFVVLQLSRSDTNLKESLP